MTIDRKLIATALVGHALQPQTHALETNSHLLFNAVVRHWVGDKVEEWLSVAGLSATFVTRANQYYVGVVGRKISLRAKGQGHILPRQQDRVPLESDPELVATLLAHDKAEDDLFTLRTKLLNETLDIIEPLPTLAAIFAALPGSEAILRERLPALFEGDPEPPDTTGVLLMAKLAELRA